ncbi:alpha/beta hydrolase [Leucobacter sp. wl10]|uniref:alpha/beta hydrolase n=1 Tax=Leucobacter sp. wl10 TaxID=2304677 RepID=UPI000E5A20B0|nr:alpha/beta hydrolase [Leucobacter sp. wl10]RGE18550.1 alpha/beta hydrolase [Leucobacter sp. wl10]
MTAWRDDILGAGFERADLDLGADEEGPLVATLVRSLPSRRPLFDRLLGWERPLENVDVLYLHGWSDYFFQRRLAGFWTERGARFFALDLRKYGRSLRKGQTAGYIENLDDYHREIELALAAVEEDRPAGPRRLLLLGHSTGGLVLSLWASQNPGRFDALVLNSPWLEFQLASAGRQLLAPLVNLTARLNPRDVGPQLDYGFYSRAQREVGPADELALIDPAWRPDRTNAILSGWMRAILDGHARVNRGLRIDAPAAVLLSARSAVPRRWSEELTRADTVLDVDEVAKAALKLGSSVTVERIDGALHDVFLSGEGARREAYARLERWVLGWQASRVVVLQGASKAQPRVDGVPSATG